MSAPRPEMAARLAAAVAVATEHAADDDRHATFPRASVAALDDAGLLGAWVPARCGGEDASVQAASEAAAVLARACASTGVLFALHQAQVITLRRHGAGAVADALLRDVVSSGHLVSAAHGVRAAGPVVGSESGPIHIERTGVTVPFGREAHAVVLRVAAHGADPSDTSRPDGLVVCARPALALTPVEVPAPLGLRAMGTARYDVVADADGGAVLAEDAPGAALGTQSAVTAVLMAAALSGIATAAVEHARALNASESAKKRSLASLGPRRSAELEAVHSETLSVVAATTRWLDDVTTTMPGPGALPPELAEAAASTLVAVRRLTTDIVRRASSLCGIAGYRQDAPTGIGRLLRDAWGGCLLGAADETGAAA